MSTSAKLEPGQRPRLTLPQPPPHGRQKVDYGNHELSDVQRESLNWILENEERFASGMLDAVAAKLWAYQQNLADAAGGPLRYLSPDGRLSCGHALSEVLLINNIRLHSISPTIFVFCELYNNIISGAPCVRDGDFPFWQEGDDEYWLQILCFRLDRFTWWYVGDLDEAS